MRPGLMRLVLAAVIVATGLGTGPAWAGEAPAPPSGRFSAAALDQVVRRGMDDGTVRLSQGTADQTWKRKDSVLNGALIGAAIGGVGGSALIVASRGGSDNILKAMWTVSAAPALLGAAVGALIDALR